MDRLPKYLHTLWFEELQDLCSAAELTKFTRQYGRSLTRHSAFQPFRISKDWTPTPDKILGNQWVIDTLKETFNGDGSYGIDPRRKFRLDLTKIPEWLQDYADKFRGLHISADDPNWTETIACSKADDKPSLTVPVFDGKETFTEGTGLLVKETPDPYGMGC